jgi:hypothetical protein
VPMRRESSTVVALVGAVTSRLLAGLARSPNLSVVRAAAPRDEGGASPPAAAPGWEPGALAMQEAARRRSTYVIVAADPLAEVAAGWRSMWDLSAGSPGPGAFELSAAQALAAWRDKRFELPDYYLVAAPLLAGDTGPDLYLGPLRGLRPQRVAVADSTDDGGEAARMLDTLRALEHGPWWPQLDELLDAARHFFAGGLAETQSGRPRPWQAGPGRPAAPGSP